jgi:hypothetical protein
VHRRFMSELRAIGDGQALEQKAKSPRGVSSRADRRRTESRD